jgi:hypothetical protein
MRAAVLLPGPSLACLCELPKADLVVGVKRAAIAFRCHHAVILDIPCLKAIDEKFIGSPSLMTRAAYRSRYTVAGGINVEALADFCPLRCDEWSSVASLGLAGLLHASRIDVYGADFGSGPTMAEYDGFTSPEANYSPERWAREWKAFEAVADWLRGRGCEVNRVA